MELVSNVFESQIPICFRIPIAFYRCSAHMQFIRLVDNMCHLQKGRQASSLVQQKASLLSDQLRGARDNLANGMRRTFIVYVCLHDYVLWIHDWQG